MGTTFSNIHIRKQTGYSGEQIVAVLTELLREKGYRLSADGETHDAVVHVFDGDGEWVSICSDILDFDNDRETRAVIGPLSLACGTDALALSCFDSDYLFLHLVNETDGTDAWVNIGTNPEGPLPRRTGFTPWKKKVDGLDAFRSAVKGSYDCVEEALEPLQAPLHLPVTQSAMCEELLDALPQSGRLTTLRLTAMETGSPKELPSLEIPRFSMTPCEIGQPAIVSAYNRGGASRGIAVAFSGSYVEQDALCFTDVQLEFDFGRTPGKTIPIHLEKRQSRDGSWIYYWEDPTFRLPKRVKDSLPAAKKMQQEFNQSFGVRFTPVGNPRKRLDICVHFIPLENPEGRCCWCVWHLMGSKEAFLEEYNAIWSRSQYSKYRPIEEVLLNPSDFDL